MLLLLLSARWSISQPACVKRGTRSSAGWRQVEESAIGQLQTTRCSFVCAKAVTIRRVPAEGRLGSCSSPSVKRSKRTWAPDRDRSVVEGRKAGVSLAPNCRVDHDDCRCTQGIRNIISNACRIRIRTVASAAQARSVGNQKRYAELVRPVARLRRKALRKCRTNPLVPEL